MARRRSEVLTEGAHGPDGQSRARGQAPADEWYGEDQSWFLDDLRGMDPPRLVAGDPIEGEPLANPEDVVHLAARGERGHAGKAGNR
jgi:hypothetical protein